jgi:PhnB protein
MPVDPLPAHLRTVTPRLVVSDGTAAIEFYARAFGAEALGEPFATPDGVVIHAEIRIGDSVVMITQDGADAQAAAVSPERAGGVVTTILATFWVDVDAAWERALGAGAEPVYELADQFYGERSGRLRDPFGHQWMLSSVIEELSHEELERRARGD